MKNSYVDTKIKFRSKIRRKITFSEECTKSRTAHLACTPRAVRLPLHAKKARICRNLEPYGSWCLSCFDFPKSSKTCSTRPPTSRELLGLSKPYILPINMVPKRLPKGPNFYTKRENIQERNTRKLGFSRVWSRFSLLSSFQLERNQRLSF